MDTTQLPRTDTEKTSGEMASTVDDADVDDATVSVHSEGSNKKAQSGKPQCIGLLITIAWLLLKRLADTGIVGSELATYKALYIQNPTQ